MFVQIQLPVYCVTVSRAVCEIRLGWGVRQGILNMHSVSRCMDGSENTRHDQRLDCDVGITVDTSYFSFEMF